MHNTRRQEIRRLSCGGSAGAAVSRGKAWRPARVPTSGDRPLCDSDFTCSKLPLATTIMSVEEFTRWCAVYTFLRLISAAEFHSLNKGSGTNREALRSHRQILHRNIEDYLMNWLQFRVPYSTLQ